MLSVIRFEKNKEEVDSDYVGGLVRNFINRRGRSFKELTSNESLLHFYIFLFLGLGLSFTLWFIALPKEFVYDLFYLQLNTIKSINVQLSGGVVGGTLFSKILLNNFRVLAFCVLFSFIYGAGAIFILVWNASVIGVAMGDAVRNAVARYTLEIGALGISNYMSIISLSILRYMIHGIPELLGYFVGGLAGGLISIAVINQEVGTEKFQKTLQHVFGLVTLAVVMLFIAGLLEVSISPLVRI
jgi:uncharacterized membrane protein SpoIIM required for sporulation